MKSYLYYEIKGYIPSWPVGPEKVIVGVLELSEGIPVGVWVGAGTLVAEVVVRSLIVPWSKKYKSHNTDLWSIHYFNLIS